MNALSNETSVIPALRWRWFHFVVFTIAAILVGGWSSYQSDWVRKRRSLAAEGEAIFERLGNYTCGVTSDDVKPTGSTFPQKLLALFGEPPRSQVYVYYIRTDEPHHIDQDGVHEFKPTDYAKVQRAQKLFPEAMIVAVYLQRHDPGTINDVKDLLSE